MKPGNVFFSNFKIKSSTRANVYYGYELKATTTGIVLITKLILAIA